MLSRGSTRRATLTLGSHNPSPINVDAPRKQEKKWHSRRFTLLRRVFAILGLAIIMGMFTVSTGAAVTGQAQEQVLSAPWDCIGGQEFYNASPITSSVSNITFGTREGTWNQYVDGSGNVSVTPIKGDPDGHTPYEWYGAYFPFTSSYAESDFVPSACGNVEGWIGATLPSMIFALGSALATILIAVYSWSTNPDILNSLIAPVDCIVAGKSATEGGRSVTQQAINSLTALNLSSTTTSSADEFFAGTTCNSEGLVTLLYLPYLAPVVFLGALWMFWQGAIKRRSTQALQGGLWMLFASTLSIVFLVQPTLLAVKINDAIAYVNNTVVTSMMMGIAAGDPAKDMCYLENTSGVTTVNPNTSTSQGVQQTTNRANLYISQLGPRRATCALWKTLIFDAWVNGQYGDYEAALQPVTGLAVQGKGDGSGDEEWKKERERIISDMKMKFPKLTPTLALAQLDVTVLDHDELILASTVVSGKDPSQWEDIYITPATGGGKGLSPVMVCKSRETGDIVPCPNEEAEAGIMVDAERKFRALHDQIANSAENASWAPIWSGRTPTQRYSAAVTALVGTLIGGLVITVLGFLNVLYQIGMILLIIVAPLILLVGVHPGMGRRVTIKWLEALLSTGMKRILTSMLLGILVVIYASVYTMDIGWLQKVLLLAAIGVGLLMYRKQLTQMVGTVNLGGGGADSFNQGAQQMQRKATGMATGSGAAMAGAAIAGGGVGAVAMAGARSATMSRGGGVMNSGGTGWRSGSAAGNRAKAKRNRRKSNSP